MCQFDLFDKAEREWGTGFGLAELKVSANKMQGIEIEKELRKILVYDQASQRYVASSTRTPVRDHRRPQGQVPDPMTP